LCSTNSVFKYSSYELIYVKGPCHGSRGYSPASHRGDPDSIPGYIIKKCCVGPGTGTGSLPSTLAFTCHHSANALHSSSSSRCFYRERGTRSGNLTMLFRESGIAEYEITLIFLIFNESLFRKLCQTLQSPTVVHTM
jgi:hypothetical protein